MRIKINHPLANYISIQNSELSHSTDSTSEIAFFIYKGNIRKFQTTVLEEFSKYAEETEGDTLVYSYVPNELIDQFVEKYRTTPLEPQPQQMSHATGISRKGVEQ